MTIKDCVISAMKSFELEGFVYTDKEREILNKVANEELSIDEGKLSYNSRNER